MPGSTGLPPSSNILNAAFNKAAMLDYSKDSIYYNQASRSYVKQRFTMEGLSTTSARAGQYVTQANGYRAFIPAPLPPNPPVRVTGGYGKVLHGVRYLGKSRDRAGMGRAPERIR